MQQIVEYKKTNVNTADSVKMVSLLYDGAINYIRLAKRRMEDGDTAGKGLYIGKVTSIVGELSSSLNMDAGEIAKNLRRLYDFVLDRLLYANLKNEVAAFEDVERILDVLRGAWIEMEKGISISAEEHRTENPAGMEIRV